MFDLFGYSERGMVNAIFYPMRFSPDGPQMLREFLGLISFPCGDDRPNFEQIHKVTILVEQGFSDFGDLDVLLLLDDVSGRQHSVLLEAKVKTFQRAQWAINDEWTAFLEMVRLRNPGSNLFVQLYRKMRLTHKLWAGVERLAPDAIASRWCLGSNGVVTEAAKLLTPYCRDARFVALVPESEANVSAFFSTTFSEFSPSPEELPDWVRNRCGYLTWEQFKSLCEAKPLQWASALATFEYNAGQIFGRTVTRDLAPIGPIKSGLDYDYEDDDGETIRVQVLRVGSKNSRVERIGGIGPSFLAPNSSLVLSNVPKSAEATKGSRPKRGNEYLYEGDGEVFRVAVRDVGPKNSRVDRSDGIRESFLAPNYLLKPVS